MQPTLLSTMTTRAPSRGLQTAERAGAVLFVTILTAVAAQISVPLPFTPVPFSPPLEDAYVPGAADVAAAVRECVSG